MFPIPRAARTPWQKVLAMGAFAVAAASCSTADITTEPITETGAVAATAAAQTDDAEAEPASKTCNEPPDGADFLDNVSWLWGSPSSVLGDAGTEPEPPTTWTGEDYGAGLDPVRSVSADDVADLMRAAAARPENETRRVTSTFTLRFGSGWADIFGAAAVDEITEEWAAAGVVDGSGAWFLDIVDLSSEPVIAPARVGAIDGAAFDGAAPDCAAPNPGLATGLDGTPFGSGGPYALVDGTAWQAMIDAAMQPDSGALLYAAGATTLPGVGDVYSVGVAADFSATDWANLMEEMAIPSPGGDDQAGTAASGAIGFRFEIDGDGRLLSAELELGDLVAELVRSGMPSEFAMIDDPAMRIESSWRTTWRSHGADGLEVSENAPGVWYW